MTPEEAIKRIKDPKDNTIYTNEFGVEFSDQYIEASNMAISALEKQIPKKPMYYHWSGSFVDGVTGKNHGYKCPCCGKGVDLEYCPCCGQRLSWEE